MRELVVRSHVEVVSEDDKYDSTVGCAGTLVVDVPNIVHVVSESYEVSDTV